MQAPSSPGETHAPCAPTWRGLPGSPLFYFPRSGRCSGPRARSEVRFEEAMCQNETKQEAFQGTEFEIAQLSGFWDHQPLSFSTKRLEKTAHLSSFAQLRADSPPTRGRAEQTKRKTTASNRANNAGAPAFTAIGAACNLFGPHP